MHWSRVDDLPVAAVVVALRHWLGVPGAEAVAMLTWPAALLPFVAATAAAAAGASWNRVWLTMGAIASSALLARFEPGRIDHHALMTALAFAACVTVLLPGTRIRGAIAGSASALCLAVGFEDIAVLACLGAVVGLLWVVGDEGERARATGYGASLAVMTVLCEAAFVSDAARTVTACDALSGAWPAAIVLAGLAMAACATWVREASRVRRGLAAAFAAALPMAVMALGGRACAAGPFTGLSRAVVTEWLSRVNEMHDVVTSSAGDVASLASIAGVPIVMAGLCWFAWEKGRRPDPREACYLALTLVAVAIGMRYVRNCGLASAMAAPVAARCLVGRFSSANVPPRIRAAVTFALLLPAGLFLKDLMWGNANVPDEQTSACFATSSWRRAASLPVGLAMTPIDLGAMTLASTDLDVVGGAYHRAARGLDDVVTFMDGDEGTARRVLVADGVRYVVWCSRMNEVTLAPKLHPKGMGARLAHDDLPAWLIPVDVGDGPIRVARVMTDAAPREP